MPNLRAAMSGGRRAASFADARDRQGDRVDAKKTHPRNLPVSNKRRRPADGLSTPAACRCAGVFHEGDES